MKNLVFLFFAIWLVFSVISTSYNFVRGIKEFRELSTISTDVKRERVYGSLYNFLKKIEISTSPNSTLIINSSDPKAFYLSNYFLYPRKIKIQEDDGNSFKKI